MFGLLGRVAMVRPAIGMALISTVALLGAAPLRGQAGTDQAAERFLQQQRLADEQLRRQRQELAPLESLLDVQWGGWIDYYLFHFDDGRQSSRLVHRPGFAFWTRATVDNNAHELFARVRLRYTHFRVGDELDRQTDWWGPNFDQAWYGVDFARALHLAKPGDPWHLRARVGRQQVVFGTGYTLDMPLDAVLLDGRLLDMRVQGLFGKSIGSFPNIDRSEPVDSHSARLLYGVQVSYEGWRRHVPFVYALWNNDRTDERPPVWSQNFGYDSFYVGGGTRGALARNLHYWAEAVFESGRSFANRSFAQQDPIAAHGWDVGIEKLFDVATRPRLTLEYMFASGDGDRLFSPTNAVGGNRAGTKDTSFVGFGFRDTGIALAPTMSNLHVWRAGAACLPLEKLAAFRELEIGTDWYLYYKHHRRAAISDPLADSFAGYVGWEMDYFINWRVATDVAWTIRWGTFFPGSAYSDDDSRHFLFTGVTWSF